MGTPARVVVALFAVLCVAECALSLDNGLGLVPPMVGKNLFSVSLSLSLSRVIPLSLSGHPSLSHSSFTLSHFSFSLSLSLSLALF